MFALHPRAVAQHGRRGGTFAHRSWQYRFDRV